jgi:hypothetical protein
MLTRVLILLFVVLPAMASAADPIPVKAPPRGEIRLPEIAVPATMPTSPVAVTKLSANQLYVIDSDVELSVVASRDGFVSIMPEVGPLKIRGVFVDSPGGKPTTRTFKGPFLYSIEVVASGTVELILFRDIKTPPLRRTLDVDAGIGPQPPPPGPTPPPNPVDPPKPVPPVDPAPIPAAGLHVLVVYDALKLTTLTTEQQGAIYGKDVRDYLRAVCPKGEDGVTAEWRMWPVDVDASGESKLWRDALARPRKSLPWIVVSNGKTGFEGPLPGNAAEMLALLKKYGDK